MLFDDFVDLGHEANGFGEGDDDSVVVGDVVFGEGAAFAVFEPFFADLVAADVEIPNRFGDAFESGGLGFVDPDGVFRPSDFFDLGMATADELGYGLG